MIFICQGIALDGIVPDGFCQTILDSKIYFWKKTKIFLDSSKIHRNISEHYGNRGCGVFKGGIQDQEGFCIRINIPKENF